MTGQDDLPLHFAARRVLIAAAAGLVAGGVMAIVAAWQIAVLAGWCVAALVFVVRVWATVLHQDPAETARHATSEDDSRVVADLAVLLASVASLVAVGFVLVKGARAGGWTEGMYTAVGVLTVVLSWAVVHTVFALRYGHTYYTAGGGMDFHGDHPPSYRDFAYVAFTVGMTYQVSDTEMTTRPMRALVLRHALLSFVFGTAIIAMMINVVASLAH